MEINTLKLKSKIYIEKKGGSGISKKDFEKSLKENKELKIQIAKYKDYVAKISNKLEKYEKLPSNDLSLVGKSFEAYETDIQLCEQKLTTCVQNSTASSNESNENNSNSEDNCQEISGQLNACQESLSSANQTISQLNINLESLTNTNQELTSFDQEGEEEHIESLNLSGFWDEEPGNLGESCCSIKANGESATEDNGDVVCQSSSPGQIFLKK